MNEVPKDLLDFINTGKKFIVAGHKEPDGDCVGSQLALCSILRRLGKEAIPCSAGPFRRIEIKKYEHLFTTVPDKKTLEGAKVIITDCSSMDRTGDLAEVLRGLPSALVDHHEKDLHETVKHEAEWRIGPSYLRSDAPSVTFMILHLADALGVELTTEEAELLLFGLCTDTGFFRFVDTRAETFDAAARLVRAGASPKKTYHEMHGGKSLASRHFLARILSRADSHFSGRLIVSTEEFEEAKQFGLESKDTDNLYELIQSIAGVEAIVIIRQEKTDSCSVGFRSRDKVDVAKIAGAFDGGGHKNAAGATIRGTIPDVKKQILDIFQLHLSQK